MSQEHDVFEAIARLVADGEYRDWRTQTLGPKPEPPRRLPDGRPDRADYRRWLRERPKTWRFERGTAEYEEALQEGVLDPLPPLVPASEGAVAEAEATIGWSLPPLLRRLYLEVGNGGFGPRDGILGVRGGVGNGGWDDVVAVHRAFNAHPTDPLTPPAWMLWIFEWGCTVWSIVDCRDPTGPMWFNADGEQEQESMTLAEWLDRWVHCRLYIPSGPGSWTDR